MDPRSKPHSVPYLQRQNTAAAACALGALFRETMHRSHARVRCVAAHEALGGQKSLKELGIAPKKNESDRNPHPFLSIDIPIAPRRIH